MTPQELKSSILQLAIQGKLVEQRPEEGTAKELYQQIKAIMPNLSQLGRIADEEIPFDIPENWFWVRLGTALIIERGGSPRPIKAFLTDSDNGVNWIKIGDTDKGGKYINSTHEKIKPEGMKKSRFVRKGDFLLSNSMSFGRPYILNIDGCIHDGWLVLRPIVDLFEKDYLYYLLSSPMVYHQFCSRVAGAVVNNLNSEKVALTAVPIPPLAEQKRIVAKIDELLPYIDRYEESWRNLEDFNKRFPVDMQKSILQTAIQGKLVEQRPEEGTGEELYQQIQVEKQRLIKAGVIKKDKPSPEISEDEKPFDIPDSWKWVRISNLFCVGTGMTPLKSESKYFSGGQIPWITSSLTSNRFISAAESHITEYAIDNTSLSLYPAHTLIIAMYGQGKTRGQISELLIPATINQACAALGNIIESQAFITYIYYFFKFSYEVLRKKAEGTSQPNLNLKKIKETLVPLPPVNEQERIIAKLEQILPLCEKLKK